MKKMYVVLPILLVSLIPQGALHAQGHRIMTATMKTESGTRTVEVRYYAESEEWAKDILRTIREGFPLLEKRIGVPCPVTYDILVIETTSLKPGVGAVNRGSDGMLVPTGTPPHVIIHELCHYWFGWLPSYKSIVCVGLRYLWDQSLFL
jgi:aminopeptidase N